MVEARKRIDRKIEIAEADFMLPYLFNRLATLKMFSFEKEKNSGLFLLQCFWDVVAGWVFSVHVACVRVCAVSTSTTDLSVLTHTTLALEQTAILKAAVKWRSSDFSPGLL